MNANCDHSVRDQRGRNRQLKNPARFAGSVLGAFGVLALILATLGLYGVMSYLVAQRTREMGIRMALGARGLDVQGIVLRRGMSIALTGMLVGTALL